MTILLATGACRPAPVASAQHGRCSFPLAWTAAVLWSDEA